MASKTVAELFPRLEEFDSLLGAAELYAETDWDIQFTDDMRANYTRYGARMYLSDSQHTQLTRIANEN
ncbi:hypothetical protein [Pseudomonas tohonis]|uniref:hypothetical protein n=1 Tax=Pseudomonas tohonis TaxID=2725477 RepID=UPI001F2D6E6F|nr:hypothetical protein [Pseudomonas tohonis]